MSAPRRGKRGKHTSPRRLISASKQEWAAWDRAAAKVWPFTFAEWARARLNAGVSKRAISARIPARTYARKRRHK